MNIEPENLPSDTSVLQEMVLSLLGENSKSQLTIEKLQHQIEQLLRHRYGQRADRIDLDNPGLFTREILEAALLHQAKEEEKREKEEVKYERNKPKRGHGRNDIPEHLPRERIECPVADKDKTCSDCGTEKIKIREQISRQLEYIPASLYVKEFVQPVYACPAECPGQMVKGEKPAQPIEKGLAGPGLLAQVTVSKYGDHLPLNRQKDILSRHDVHISNSTQCDWARGCADLVRLLVERQKELILSSKIVQTDDTVIQVQEKNRTKTKKGRVWCYADPIRNLIVFDYTPNRNRDGPMNFLSDYSGYLVADAYTGYDGIYAAKQVMEVACWAHARRKFVEAKTSQPDVATAAVAWIARLYAVEKEAKEYLSSLSADLPEAEKQEMYFVRRHELRQEKSVELLTGFGEWLQARYTEVLPKSPTAGAIQYTLNQWQALCRYPEDGALPIDNNFAEHAMRHIAVGRKNWLFAGSDRGGETGALLTSLIYTAKLHKLNLWAYMNDVFTRIPTLPISRLEELLPHRWKEIRVKKEEPVLVHS
jgi:transposase